MTGKYASAKQAMRNGVVNAEQAENYRQFKLALRELCADPPDESPFRNAVVEELDSRHGYGFALRHALRHLVKTKFVCVVQHDRTFMRPAPVRETVEAMLNHPNVKYVGMSMRSNLMYRDIFVGKYGRKFSEEHRSMVLRLPELVVDAVRYGPDSESTRSMDCKSEKVRDNINAVVETYRLSSQWLEERERVQLLQQQQHNGGEGDPGNDKKESPSAAAPLPPGKHQMTLTPTLFWYDNVHIAETEHYRDFVFNPKYKMVARGGFVEDKLSPVMKRTVERLGLREGHSRFGCYLLDDHSGMFFTGHLDGGSYLTPELKKKILDSKNVEPPG